MDGAAPRGAKGDNSCLNSVWNSKRIVTIDLLGDEFLETVQMGEPIVIYSDGRVEIGQR